MLDQLVSLLFDFSYVLLHRAHARILFGPEIDHFLRRIRLEPGRFGNNHISARLEQGTAGFEALFEVHDVDCAFRPEQVELLGRKIHLEHGQLTHLNLFIQPGLFCTADEFVQKGLVKVDRDDLAP